MSRIVVVSEVGIFRCRFGGLSEMKVNKEGKSYFYVRLAFQTSVPGFPPSPCSDRYENCIHNPSDLDHFRLCEEGQVYDFSMSVSARDSQPPVPEKGYKAQPATNQYRVLKCLGETPNLVPA